MYSIHNVKARCLSPQNNSNFTKGFTQDSCLYLNNKFNDKFASVKIDKPITTLLSPCTSDKCPTTSIESQSVERFDRAYYKQNTSKSNSLASVKSKRCFSMPRMNSPNSPAKIK